MVDGDFWIYLDGIDYVIKVCCKGKNFKVIDLKEKNKSIVFQRDRQIFSYVNSQLNR